MHIFFLNAANVFLMLVFWLFSCGVLSSQAVFDEFSLYLLQAAVFAEAFPSFTGSSSSDSCDLSTVPTLSQLLRGGASHDQG